MYNQRILTRCCGNKNHYPWTCAIPCDKKGKIYDALCTSGAVPNQQSTLQSFAVPVLIASSTFSAEQESKVALRFSGKSHCYSMEPSSSLPVKFEKVQVSKSQQKSKMKKNSRAHSPQNQAQQIPTATTSEVMQETSSVSTIHFSCSIRTLTKAIRTRQPWRTPKSSE